MNRRLAGVAAAAVVLAGAVSVVVPQHALSASRVLAVTIAVIAGALVLGAVAPLVSQDPPRTAFDARPRGEARPLDPHGLRDARRDLGRPARAGDLPAPVFERLRVAAALRTEQLGFDPEDPRAWHALERRLGPDTWRRLAVRPAPGPVSDRSATAAIVHRTLDELTLIDGPTGADHGSD